ncbi:MAG: orotidine-5'-phosphate decarboxylase [Desulfobacteraceae bacterium]|nr:orotidine-5'-phosphate decarboxylase [Desulfobacteraceae bacterium]
MQNKNIPLNERIIFALDVPTPDEARELVKKVESRIGFYKVGLQLFLAGWFPIVEWIADRGHRVMVDLKFYDIPETVKLAVAQLNGRQISFATVHGVEPVMKAAAEAKEDVAILAVTVLTSMGAADVASFGKTLTVEDLVLERARRAVEAGVDGVVCSGLEAGRLRRELGGDFLIVTPGVRPGNSDAAARHDQKRIVTAGIAVRNGADHVVVGRPIRDASDPVGVIEAMQQDISDALSQGAPHPRAAAKKGAPGAF